MADTHESIQFESESNASELSLSCGSSPFDDGDNVSDTDSVMPKQKMQVKSMKSKSTHISTSLTAMIPTILTKTGRQKIHH